jgi:methylthioribose-1-phosphate isomerase
MPFPDCEFPDPMPDLAFPFALGLSSLATEGFEVRILDQRVLPHDVRMCVLRSLEDSALAIESMQVRGAPLIGVTAAYGVALALKKDASDQGLENALCRLGKTRPTAVNLHWALAQMAMRLEPLAPHARPHAAWQQAQALHRQEQGFAKAIGVHGLEWIKAQHNPNRPFQVLTHCNAGALATVGPGTALAPLYAAHRAGIDIHVWVSETRPRNQGWLTEWELRQAGVPCTLIADNAAAYLMTKGDVDWVIVGADRIARNGDTANKIGTALKAMAAHWHRIPFHVAAPSSTIDWACHQGEAIPIEARDPRELLNPPGTLMQVDIHLLSGRTLANPAFDVTPADLITGFITEQGICTPSSLQALQK